MQKNIIIVMLVLIALIFCSGPRDVLAHTGSYEPTPTPDTPQVNTTTVFRPDLFAIDPMLEPGVDGYKIYQPGAIASVTIKPESILASSLSYDTRTLYRLGATDAFKCNCTGGVWKSGCGDHDSSSDLFEDTIWVDGCIRKYGSSSWSDCDDDHTSGYIAHADTCMSGGLFYSFEARSWHYFHTDGYIDNSFSTTDIAW